MDAKKFLNTCLVLFFSGVFIFGLYGFTNSDDNTLNENKYITMRLVEIFAGDKSLTIIYPDGKSEKIDLEGVRRNNMTKNLDVLNDNINKISKLGYDLKFVTPKGENHFIVDYIFERRR